MESDTNSDWSPYGLRRAWGVDWERVNRAGTYGGADDGLQRTKGTAMFGGELDEELVEQWRVFVAERKRSIGRHPAFTWRWSAWLAHGEPAGPDPGAGRAAAGGAGRGRCSAEETGTAEEEVSSGKLL